MKYFKGTSIYYDSTCGVAKVSQQISFIYFARKNSFFRVRMKAHRFILKIVKKMRWGFTLTKKDISLEIINLKIFSYET